MEGRPGLNLILLFALIAIVRSEFIQTFDVLEGVPVGTVIGVIGSDGSSDIPKPPYLIVPLAGSADPDADLIINQKTGEIRTKSDNLVRLSNVRSIHFTVFGIFTKLDPFLYKGVIKIIYIHIYI